MFGEHTVTSPRVLAWVFLLRFSLNLVRSCTKFIVAVVTLGAPTAFKSFYSGLALISPLGFEPFLCVVA